MHNNYYFLKQLTPELGERIKNLKVSSCFSQNKDELIISFGNKENEFYIKAFLSASFCCLSFPENFHRARKNSVDLFNEVLNKTVLSTYQYLNERCFSIKLEDGYEFLFKMHGNRSNIILFNNRQIVSLFNKHLTKDQAIDITSLDRHIDQSKEAFINSEGNTKLLFPTFGKDIESLLNEQGLKNLSLPEQWNLVENTLAQLDKREFFIRSDKLSLLPFEDSKRYGDPLTALNNFYIGYISSSGLEKEKREIVNALEKNIKRSKSFINKTKQKLSEINNKTSYQILGDLVMANLHAIDSSSDKVELTNFYDENRPIEIKLKRHFTPQKNAENFYKKAKNQSKEIKNLEEVVESKEFELLSLEEHYCKINKIEHLKDLREYIKTENLLKTATQQKVNKPYNLFIYQGFDIWVGKNASANDEMLRHTYKEDLWLHAKDVAGSHVIIKYKSGSPFPVSVKEKAAQLAAYYSKRKTDSLCPVIITPRKFVRKRKGDPPGAVVVDKEQTLLVEPSNQL
ncbi:NFACT RNA binding domain-containing protein [Fulvivirga sp.]|uniref:NFACT RNA binding domain-containing protein n=1 Tax=Fulvivirga sp. TaxID=1931237 RepID=UPI0032F0416F